MPPQLKPCIGILTAIALSFALPACGDSSKSTPPAPSGEALVTAYFPHDKNDRDNDSDHNNDDAKNLNYGSAASPTELRETRSLVRRYYAAAVAANGAQACALLVPFFAESVVEQYGHLPSASGRTCAAVMSKIFRNYHAQIASKNATLRIPDVRVQNERALVILEFPSIPEVRQIHLRRIGDKWRLLELLDSIIE
ncbi:MAG: hypothetical protein WAU42_10525 [Solirubrobacteraceae bacterium]